MAWAMVVGPRVVGIAVSTQVAEALTNSRVESLIPSETGWTTFAGRRKWAQGLVFEQTGGSPPS